MCQDAPADQASETGIDAIPEADAIRIEWIVGQEADLDGYEVYRRLREDPRDTLVAELPLEAPAGDTAFWVDTAVSIGRRYYYRVRAVDEAGNQSPFSEAADYQLLAKLVPRTPRGQIAESVPNFVFLWGDDPLGITHFVVKVTDSAGHYLWISDPDQGMVVGYGSPGTRSYNADGRALQAELGPGTYLWRVDAVGAEERTGSESAWTPFTVTAQ